MGQSILIRYGLMGQVGRFAAEPHHCLDRGQTVVVRSHRGTELGEVLLAVPADPSDAPASQARVLRPAEPADLDRARLLGTERDARFADCRRVFGEGVWPIDLIDVEPLLDDGRTVLYYLGPHRLDTAGILAAFRATTALDVLLEPVGRDVPDDEPETVPDEPDDHGCGRCGSDGGGCGSSGGGCGTGHGGCSTCGVKQLLAANR